jgi:hypothetical protein
MIGFYVTMRRGRRTAFLAGPYDSLDDAKRAVPSAMKLAAHLDPWADFDSFGVTGLIPPARLGVFNHLVRNDMLITLAVPSSLREAS